MSSRRRLACTALAGFWVASCGARSPANAPASEPPENPPAVAAPAEPGTPAAAHEGFEPDGRGFLSAIPVDVSARAKALVSESASDEAFARGLRVRILVMSGYRELGELSRRAKVPLVNGTFQLSDLTKLGSRDAPTKRDLASSFVVDFDEPTFAAPVAELERSGSARSPVAITAFVANYIDEKTYARSFDVASRVAVSRSGDCTEHAVLTAALLRRFGFKARVIFGIVLVGVAPPNAEAELVAFGHAWVERHDGARWLVADAALQMPDQSGRATLPAADGLPPGTSIRLAYLPITVLKDESASYSRALMDHAGVESVRRVEVDVGGSR